MLTSIDAPADISFLCYNTDMNIRTLAEATAELVARGEKAERKPYYDLERMRRLMAFLGNPQDAVPAIHVAGTSGKTSTAYYAAALLQAAGKRVGLTVSPHVVAINDRVQINGEPLPEEEFCRLLTHYLQLVDSSGTAPSFFELMLGFAYWVFAHKQLDFIVVEVGVGGLLDPSNVITRTDKVCVITDIGFDHMDKLGKTLAAIASQKAGIIQPHNTVCVRLQAPEIMQQIELQAKKRNADVLVETDDYPLEALPPFQRRNMSLAVAAVVHALKHERHLIDDVVVKQAAQKSIPGRMETVHIDGRPLILDGAHNAQKIMALRQAIQTVYPGKQVAVLAAFTEKDADGIERMIGSFAELTPLNPHVIATTFGGPEDWPRTGADVEMVAAAAKAAGTISVETLADVATAYEALLQHPADVRIVTGSFYLLNHVCERALEESQ